MPPWYHNVIEPRIFDDISPLGGGAAPGWRAWHLRALGSQARQRLAVMAVVSLLVGLMAAGTDVILPLWCTHELHYSAAQWAQMRSLRFIGVVGGVIVLGGLSDRFGQRLVGALSLIVGGVLLAVLAVGGRHVIWVITPIFGALTSTAYVNLNTLVQLVSDHRQGLANTVYRTVMAAAATVAPILVTAVAALNHSFIGVLCGTGLLLSAAGGLLFLYPIHEPRAAVEGLGVEIRRLVNGYAAAHAQRSLMNFIHISLVFISLLVGVGIFAAIRFTTQLGLTDRQFGILSTSIGAMTLLMTAGLGVVLDKVSLRKLHLWTGVFAAIGSVLMGIGDNLVISIVGYALNLPLLAVMSGPTSMWVSRAAGDGTRISAFSVQKIASAAYIAAATALCGWLEHKIGMRLIFLYGGMLGLIGAFAFAILPEPPHPAQKTAVLDAPA